MWALTVKRIIWIVNYPPPMPRTSTHSKDDTLPALLTAATFNPNGPDYLRPKEAFRPKETPGVS